MLKLGSISQEFPILSKLDPAVYGPPESAITKELIEQEINGMSVEKVLIALSSENLRENLSRNHFFVLQLNKYVTLLFYCLVDIGY